MFMSCIISYLIIEVFSAPNPIPDRTTILPEPVEVEHCQGDNCRPPQNLIGPIVGAVGGVVASVVVSIFIVWIYLKRKNQKNKEITKTPEVKVIEYPSLYTGAISTTDSGAKLYGMSSLSRNDSINSHYYEKIHYNE